MTRPKYIRRPLDMHPVEWCGGPLSDIAAMRRLLGKGVEVADDWQMEVEGVARMTSRHLRGALSCMAMGHDIGRHASDFCFIAEGTPAKQRDDALYRVVDRILTKLKSCGAITYDAKTRRWVVTPCEWVEA